ncbi:hypothetical protein [Paraburkholderia domus]|uniref:hypothetical protein n=1 Tax=Paraburkholderia domus TaxID=2793075 RepID=UPI0019135F9A|nr:hypothetical protein [Paraburkholderia domus]MBK5065745.1 hypothetical protein [Burkholderia sp. R-70199]CAE6962525.1 hypothetical protein R70199_07429 [Paraburkholderia domus]
MYTALVQRFKDAQTKAAAAYLEVCAAEAALFPKDDPNCYRAVQTRADYRTERELSDFCFRLAHVMVTEAIRRFSPAGGRLEIDDKKELANASVDITEALRAGKCPDLDAFWAHLERTFSGDAGKRIGMTQAAKLVIDGFGIRPNSEIKRTTSAIVLDARIYSEACYRSSARKATYHSQSTATGLMRGLGAFAGHAGFDALSSELKHGRLVDYEFETREKVSLNGLDIVMFNEKWQFKFAHQVGDALSLFISEFGADYLATRDRY